MVREGRLGCRDISSPTSGRVVRFGHDRQGFNHIPRPRPCGGSCRSASSPVVVSERSRRLLVGHAADLAVAQPVVDEREELARQPRRALCSCRAGPRYVGSRVFCAAPGRAQRRQNGQSVPRGDGAHCSTWRRPMCGSGGTGSKEDVWIALHRNALQADRCEGRLPSAGRGGRDHAGPSLGAGRRVDADDGFIPVAFRARSSRSA